MNRQTFIYLIVLALSYTSFASGKVIYSSEEIKQMTIEERIEAVKQILRNELSELDPIERKEAAFGLLRFEPFLDDFPNTKGAIYMGLSGQLSESGAFILSAEYKKLALKIYKKTDPDKIRNGIFSSISWNYYNAGLRDSALVYLRKSIAEDQNTTATLYNNAGMLYHKLGIDSAGYYYELALTKLYDSNAMLRTNIQDNMAQFKFEKGLYEEAIQLQQANLDFLNQREFVEKGKSLEKILYRKTKALFGLVQCQLALNQISDVHKSLIKAQHNFEQLESTKFERKLIKQFYALQIEYNDKIQDHYSRAHYLESLLKYQEAKILEEDAASKYALNELFDRKRTTFEKEIALQKSLANQKEQSLQYQKLQMYFILFLLGPVLLLCILFYRKKLKAKRQELEIQRMNIELAKAEAQKVLLEKQQLSKSLRQTEKDLLDISTFLSDNQNWTKTLLDQLQTLSNSKKDTKEDLEILTRDISSRLQVNERMNLIYENIDKVNHSFYDTLSKKFPNLTEVEKEICGLLRLNLSNKDIAIYRNVSPQAVKMNRYRLRKKFELDSDVNLYHFLKNMEKETPLAELTTP